MKIIKRIFSTQNIRRKTTKVRQGSAQWLQMTVLVLFFIAGMLGDAESNIPLALIALAAALMLLVRLVMTLGVMWSKDGDRAWVITSIVIFAVSALLSLIMWDFFQILGFIAVIGVPFTFLQFIIFGFARLKYKNFGKSPESDGTQGISKQNREFVRQLDGLYAAVPSGKKSPIAKQVKRIRESCLQAFGVIAKNPALASNPAAHELMDYCLPQTLKLMQNYLEFTKKKVKGENIEKILTDIIKSLGAMGDAVDKQLNSLYAGIVLDVKTDMAVTKNIGS